MCFVMTSSSSTQKNHVRKKPHYVQKASRGEQNIGLRHITQTGRIKAAYSCSDNNISKSTLFNVNDIKLIHLVVWSLVIPVGTIYMQLGKEKVMADIR